MRCKLAHALGAEAARFIARHLQTCKPDKFYPVACNDLAVLTMVPNCIRHEDAVEIEKLCKAKGVRIAGCLVPLDQVKARGKRLLALMKRLLMKWLLAVLMAPRGRGSTTE